MNTMMRQVLLIASIAVPGIALAVASPSPAADLGGKIFSASGTLLGGAGEATLLSIEAGSAVIVTQYCQSGGDFGPLLQGSTFGVIPSGGEGNCTSYEPGVLLRGEQTVSCVSSFGGGNNTYCMITGYKLRP